MRPPTREPKEEAPQTPSRERRGQDQVILNTAGYTRHSLIHGPGARSVLWLQGCNLHCRGCQNPELLPVKTNRLRTVDELYETITATKGIEGLTISGGEPTLQAEPLAELCQRLQGHGRSIILYSGFTLEELRRQDQGVQSLLEVVDILIDGRYEPERKARLPLRGSCNQKIWHLSNRYKPKDITNTSTTELHLANQLRISGFKGRDFERTLRAQLEKRGVEV